MSDSWKTPPDIFTPLNNLYRFSIDACAEEWNAQVPKYWTQEQNGLKQTWRNEIIWCNPPYGRGLITPWVVKALGFKAYITVMLLPVRTATPWFEMIWDAHRNKEVSIDFLRHRIAFIPPPGVMASSPMEDSFVAVFYGDKQDV